MAPRSARPAVIHLVDDEPLVTDAIGSFLELETDHEVHAFTGGEAALAALATAPPDVVVSDFMMPGMNGLEYLAEVRRREPDVPRLLLTGYADKENAIRAINEVGLFQYLEKPLDNAQLLQVLQNALNERGLRSALGDKIRELDHALHQRDELTARDEEMRRELEFARRIQERFLPEAVPEIAGFLLDVVDRPSMTVGGDFHDFVALGGGRLAVVVADSAGHGVQAALGTALLKFAVARLQGRDARPGEILAAMNEVLFQGLPREIPVAAAAAVLEPGSGRVVLAGAGLPRPLLVGADGEVRQEPATGLLLGLVDAGMYTAGTETAVDLAAGDTLLVMSDGVTEAQNADEDFYGEGPLVRDAAALAGDSALARGLADRAEAFGLPEHRDDLTIVSIARPTGEEPT